MAGACVATERMESPWFPRFDSRHCPIRSGSGLASLHACLRVLGVLIYLYFRFGTEVLYGVQYYGAVKLTVHEQNATVHAIQ